MLQLKVGKRNIFGKKLKQAKEEGKLPAVLYGKGKLSQPLFVDLNEFKKIKRQTEESTIIRLVGESPEISADVLIYETAVEPMRGNFIHVDFYALDVDKPITANVLINFEGVSSAVKELGGILVKVLHEIELEALPKNFPHEITVDLSLLKNIGDKIVIKDIQIPNVKILAHDDQIVVLAKHHQEEKIEEAPQNIADIELSKKKGKKEEVGAAEEKTVKNG